MPRISRNPRWKSRQGVLLWWPVLHVLITLLSHLGQAELFGTCWVGHSWRKQQGRGVWWFRSALRGGNFLSSLRAAGDWVKKGSYHTAWSVPWDSSCTCSYAYGSGLLPGHVLESGVGHCQPLCGGLSHP